MKALAWGAGVVAVASVWTGGCSKGGGSAAVLDGSAIRPSGPGDSGDAANGSQLVSDAGGSPILCSDLFDQTVVPAYSIDISADNWAKLTADFNDLQDVLAGNPPETYYPVTFHYGAETVTDAAIKLRGKSSWVNTVLHDANPKMQFDVSFDQIDSKGKFHGVSSIHLSMPRDDWTFINNRIGDNWLRKIGQPAPCANNATFTVNGAYYGLYVAEGSVGKSLLEQYFPGNSAGDLFKGGTQAETNTASPNWARLDALNAAADIATLSTLVDVPHTVLDWAAEAVVEDCDGYYGGAHNYYIYDQGAPGWVWITDHTDSALEWAEIFTGVSYKEHPIYWWAGRVAPDKPGTDYLLVMNDPAARQQYVNAVATQVAKWDPDEIAGWIAAWTPQIAGALAADPHKWATVAQAQMAVASLEDMVKNRPQYLQSFVACEQGSPADATDADGDGVPWCNDCDDGNAAVHPGAPEICGNHVDDNCNGVVDENCPGEPPGYPGQPDGGATDAGNADGGARG
ncbi:MAG TPA: CotH kinase family protein [Polyangia bacterium]|nr:CotH kinase family protein [Polyangia bacterium]